MASIFSAAKSMISKITDDLNKDKWDKNCINTALFTDPEPGKMVPPNRDQAKDGNGSNAATAAAAPEVAEKAVAEPAPNVPIVAPAPQIDYGKSEPQVKQNTTVSEEPKKEPVRFVNPRFSRAIPYVTSKVKKPEDAVRSLSDLPVVDPSQSISNIAEVKNPGEEPEVSEVSVASETVAAAPVETPVSVTETEAAAAEPVVIPEYNPTPVAEVQEEIPAVEIDTAPVAAAEAPAAAEEEEKCYYVLITHRKIYPEKGSRVMMRNCDSQYAWTDSVDESKKPTFPTCPVCGKTIEYIETEMD